MANNWKWNEGGFKLSIATVEYEIDIAIFDYLQEKSGETPDVNLLFSFVARSILNVISVSGPAQPVERSPEALDILQNLYFIRIEKFRQRQCALSTD